MHVRPLMIPGAYELTASQHHDHRGVFFEWFTQKNFISLTGSTFQIDQVNCSISAAGVLRGLHFAQFPPGQAKYITCITGVIFDVVVDIRVGSPTFGQWDSVILDGQQHRSVYLPADVAHGFFALKDHSTVMYLCSHQYSPEREHTIYPLDPVLNISWPQSPSPILSERDAAAPLLADVIPTGLLPQFSNPN